MGTIDLSRLRIGDGVTSDYKRCDLSSSDVIRSLSAFAEENFRGILSLDVEGSEGGIITICADGLAFFLKMLLYRVFGRAEIKATVVGERREFHITFDLCGVQIERDGLLEIAERSGFKGEVIDEYKIRLSTPVKRTHALRVYAGDADAISRALYTVFFINFDNAKSE